MFYVKCVKQQNCHSACIKPSNLHNNTKQELSKNPIVLTFAFRSFLGFKMVESRVENNSFIFVFYVAALSAAKW